MDRDRSANKVREVEVHDGVDKELCKKKNQHDTAVINVVSVDSIVHARTSHND